MSLFEKKAKKNFFSSSLFFFCIQSEANKTHHSGTTQKDALLREDTSLEADRSSISIDMYLYLSLSISTYIEIQKYATERRSETAVDWNDTAPPQ